MPAVAQRARLSAALRVRASMSTEKLPAPLAVSVVPAGASAAAKAASSAASARSLAGRIERRRARLGDQQRALAGRVEPDVELAARLARRLPAFRQRQREQRRIARDQRLDGEAGRRCEVACASLERGAEAGAIEHARRVVGRQQVAIRQQVLGQQVEPDIAIRDEAEPLVAAQRRDQRARRRGQRLGAALLRS